VRRSGELDLFAVEPCGSHQINAPFALLLDDDVGAVSVLSFRIRVPDLDVDLGRGPGPAVQDLEGLIGSPLLGQGLDDVAALQGQEWDHARLVSLRHADLEGLELGNCLDRGAVRGLRA